MTLAAIGEANTMRLIVALGSSPVMNRMIAAMVAVKALLLFGISQLVVGPLAHHRAVHRVSE
jgi:hypothetical protein